MNYVVFSIETTSRKCFGQNITKNKYFEAVMIRKITLFILELLPIIYLKAHSVTMLRVCNPALSRDRNDEEKNISFFGPSVLRAPAEQLRWPLF